MYKFFMVLKKTSGFFIAFILLMQSCLAAPEQILIAMIQQFQTGQLIQSWYSPTLWNVIYQQTNGMGIYPQLQQLGPVQQVKLTASQGFPQGNVFRFEAQHINGFSQWVIGIGSLSNQIDYAFFNVGNSTTSLPRLPQPTSTPTTTPSPPVTPDSTSCQLYPDLC